MAASISLEDSEKIARYEKAAKVAHRVTYWLKPPKTSKRSTVFVAGLYAVGKLMASEYIVTHLPTGLGMVRRSSLKVAKDAAKTLARSYPTLGIHLTYGASLRDFPPEDRSALRHIKEWSDSI